MKKAEIKVGGLYTARISGNFVTVRVDAIREVETTRGTDYRTGRGKPCDVTVYDITNLKTGRKTTFGSAAKFRSVAKEPTTTTNSKWLEPTSTIEQALGAEYGRPKDTPATEGDNSSDPTQSANVQPAEPSVTTDLVPIAEVNNSSPVTFPSVLLAEQIATVPQITGHKPTDEQQAIIDVVKGLTGVLVIEAGAGAGKTSTLKMLEQVLPGIGQYTAFNSSLVAESKSKFRKAACNTTHSLAFRAVGSKFKHRLGGSRVRSSDVARMLGLADMKLDMGTDERGEPRSKTLDAGYLASQVMVAIRRFCQSADNELATEHFRYINGIEVQIGSNREYKNNNRVREYLLPFAVKAWADLSDTTGMLPFSHDHYVKIWQLDNPVIAADYILLDEAQDTAPVMLDVLRQQKALIILVGDSAQQIYEWRGAVNALASFEDAPRKYLSQSFRFGQAVADVANSVLESMEVPTQLRLKGLPAIDSRVEPVDNPTCILCRTNAAAVATVLNAIGAGRKPHLIGGGDEMVRFVEAALDLQQGRSTSHPELACFQSWTEVQSYVKLDEGEDLKLQVKLIDEFGAKEILTALKNMPDERNADLVVSTAHKSKGREWDTVRLAQDFPTNSKSDDSDRKLLYVAATRAKLVLDISQCPFFTGQDALEIVKTAPMKIGTPDAVMTNGAVEYKTTAKPTPTTFSWARGKDGRTWLIRGPVGAEGTVEVYRANGSKSNERVGKMVWQNQQVALYQVG